MLATAVHLTQRGFNLYHAHVFAYRKENDELQIVACGYKEGDEHEGTHGTAIIPLQQEQSLVARAGRTQKPVIVNDVRSDPNWLPNPLLPDSHAELAVPMIVGDELLGVLDVQADHVDAFTEEDANIQMTLAAQIATALKNAQSYTEAQAQADLASMVNTIGQKIQRTTTMEETLQTAIREIGNALGASRVSANLQGNRQKDNNGANLN
jgi:GAF domain-containing protein